MIINDKQAAELKKLLEDLTITHSEYHTLDTAA